MMRYRHGTAMFTLLAVTACTAPQGAMAPMAGIAPPLRPCPDWSRVSREDFSNRTASNFGCADAVNFHAQLVNPHDAVEGQGGSAGDAAAGAAAIDRMRTRPAQSAPAASPPAMPGGTADPGA